MSTPEKIQHWIESGLPGAEVSVNGDGRHFEALIIDDHFKNKSLIQRHQMVYGALGDKMQAEIHALSMKTLTTEEHRASVRGACD